MDYSNLKELIDYFEAFGKETGSQDIPAFAAWLHQKTNLRVEKNPRNTEVELDWRIAQEMGKLTNFTKHYIKKAIRKTPLAGWNDLVAIIVLFYSGSRRKTELIQMSLMELSPGMEVLRRLLRLELITEFPDPDDGRAKRVKLTDAGRNIYIQLEGEINHASKIVGGNLSLEEKHQLAVIAEKLTHFHYPIWNEDADSEMEVILEKYFLD
jgi:DNA-binding MarR family transcriptional regulator